MAATAGGGAAAQHHLLSAIIADIKSYTGDDPLLPWLHGIRTLQRSLPPPLLASKLPRLLQKCVQTFETDPRYLDDSRYLRVWIQLMDYVEDARPVLRKMERNGIGVKRAVFYSAYAMYYEKKKRFDDADRMYQLGAQNLAEPAAELQKSYEQFLHRLLVVQKRRANLQGMPNTGKSTSKRIPPRPDKSKITQNYKRNEGEAWASQVSSSAGCLEFDEENSNDSTKYVGTTKRSVSKVKTSFPNRKEGSSCTSVDMAKPSPFCTDDTVVVKFVGFAIEGKSEAEDACHHGLVDPTVNMKEAMNAISCMFREPLEEPMAKRSHRSKPKANQQSSVFEVYADENSEGPRSSYQNLKNGNQYGAQSDLKQMATDIQKPFSGEFKIFADDEDDECGVGNGPRPTDRTSRRRHKPRNSISGFREDTVVRRFVGSTVQGAPEVENACHHGLVDPTINMKEAMNDINNMFGKPLDYLKVRRHSKKSNSFVQKPANIGFSILADDDLESDSKGEASSSICCRLNGLNLNEKPLDNPKIRKQDQENILFDQKPINSSFSIFADDDMEKELKGKASSRVPRGLEEGDLFEPTVFTKEAMADINAMFGKSLDF